MQFYKKDLKMILRNITDEYYLNNKYGLTEKEYSDKMWNLMNKEFILDTSTELFKIKCRKDKETNSKFLWRFIVLNSSIDLNFTINNEKDEANITIFKKFLNKQNLRAIMDFMYQNTVSYLDKS